MKESIWIGFDPREAAAFAVACHSIRKHLTRPIPIRGIVLSYVIAAGLYTRPTESTINSDGHKQLIDRLSIRDDYNGAMSTEFAISRFLIQHLAGRGWALFADCDILARGNVARLFDTADNTKAVMCVRHNYKPVATTKMDGQSQSTYSRKNWSSVFMINTIHPANAKLTIDLINSATGRDLHNFCWLDDADIGELDPTWNWLAGESASIDNPQIVHHTLGSPCMVGYENAPYADEWRESLASWAGRP